MVNNKFNILFHFTYILYTWKYYIENEDETTFFKTSAHLLALKYETKFTL